MKYVMIDEEGKVISDVKNMLDSKVPDYISRFISVEGLDNYPSIGDIYKEDGTWEATPLVLLDALEARDLRDTYLKNSDWIMQAHTEGAFDSNPAFDIEEWKAFRKGLRDLEVPNMGDTIPYTSSIIPIRPVYPLHRG